MYRSAKSVKMSSQKSESDEVAEEAANSEDTTKLDPVNTGSTSKVNLEAPVDGKRRKISLESSNSDSKCTGGAKRSKTQNEKRLSKRAAKSNASEAASNETSASTAADEAPLSSISHSLSIANINEASQSDHQPSSSEAILCTKSTLDTKVLVETSSQTSTPDSAATKRADAATATDTSGNAPATNDNEQQPSSSSHESESTDTSNERHFLDLSSTGIPFIISVKKELFTPPTTRQNNEESSDGSETQTTVPHFVPATETSGGHQRCFLRSTAAGVPLGVSVQNATCGGQTTATNVRCRGQSGAWSLRERFVTCRRPTFAGQSGPLPPRPALSAMILQGQDYDDEYNEVPIGPPWGSTQFHDEITGLQSVIHISPLCVTVRRNGHYDNINVRPLRMGENINFKLRMMMLVGKSPPKWLSERPGPIVGMDNREDCSIYCWLVYDDAQKDKITTVTIWKQLAATWPALIGTNTRVLPRETTPTDNDAGIEQKPPVIQLPDPSDLDAAYARIMAAVSRQLRSVL